jgi:hypothetical protein
MTAHGLRYAAAKYGVTLDARAHDALVALRDQRRSHDLRYLERLGRNGRRRRAG